MASGKKITDPLQVTVTDDLRDWSAKKYGHAYLPDVFIQDFHDHCIAKEPKYKNAVAAFQNWITNSGPGKRFYDARYWEEQLRRAKKMGLSKRMSEAPLFVAGQHVEGGKVTSKEPCPTNTVQQAAARALNRTGANADAMATMRRKLGVA